MNSHSLPLALLAWGFLAGLPSTATAQSSFAVKVGDTYRVVRGITGADTPVADMGTEMKPVIGRDYTMLNFPFFRKGFVALTNIKATTFTLNDFSGNHFNNEFRIEGLAKSDTEMKQCFMVLELVEQSGTSVLFTKLPDFPKDQTVPIDIKFGLNGAPEEGHYFLHIYSTGFEVLTSRFPQSYIDAQKMKTTAISEGKTDFRPILRRSVAPIRPKSVSPSVMGRVTVEIKVSPGGDVTSATTRSPSDADFVEVALTAVKQWKFDPGIKDKKFVETTVVIPIAFPIVPLPKK